MSFCLVPGNASEHRQLAALLDGVPMEQVGYLIADRAFDVNSIREMLQELGIEAVIPPRSSRLEQFAYNKAAYKGRHLVENNFVDYKQYRGIATRYCKLSETFAGRFQLVAWRLQTKERLQRGSERLENL